MQVLSIKGRAQSAHLVQKDTDAPNIRLEIIGVALDDFRAEIVRRADDSRSHLCSRLQYSRNSKVTQLNHTILHEEDVLRLDISM